MRLYVPPAERRPDPPPMVTDDRAAVLTGIAAWTGSLIVAIALHGRLSATGRGWWAWTAVAGVLLGLAGLAYLARRDRRIQAARTEAAAVTRDPSES